MKTYHILPDPIITQHLEQKHLTSLSLASWHSEDNKHLIFPVV